LTAKYEFVVDRFSSLASASRCLRATFSASFCGVKIATLLVPVTFNTIVFWNFRQRLAITDGWAAFVG